MEMGHRLNACMLACARVRVCVCVCVCVFAGEEEREQERERGVCVFAQRERVSVCVCVGAHHTVLQARPLMPDRSHPSTHVCSIPVTHKMLC